ncbi:hypothetical protein KXR53_26080 [Inquilinus limosus]|uniref:DUF6678 family protein n=1 Tax=Inquilinus limosus TaxID=171674 RepID=UPI003F1671C9
MGKQSILDPAAVGRLARARFSVALMSDSKWRKLLAAVRDGRDDINHVMVKFIDVDEPRRMRFPLSLSCPRAYADTIEFGPVELRAIEWIEFATDLTSLLDPIGRFPLELRDGQTRIIGYQE